MSYCINPKCRQRNNQTNAQKCEACGTSLVINNDDRPYSTSNTHRYRIINLIKYNPNICTEIFEVEDLDPRDSIKFKILKAIHDNDISDRNGEKLFKRLTELFKREQNFLYYNLHPGIPKGYDIFSFTLSSGKKLHCLVMEKIEGINLEEWVRENRAIKQELALQWLKQIVEILEFVNQKDFFHRDIKPSNIMWRQSDHKLFLIDFGAVKEINRTVIDQDGRQITTEIGTPGYVAPEQKDGDAVLQSDFYALGRTFVYLLTNKHPLEIKDEKPISRWREFIIHPMSESLIQLINDLMEESKDKRPQNAQIILARLAHIREEIATPPPSNSSEVAFQTPTNPPQLGNQQRRGWLIKSAVIAIGVVTIAAILIPLLVGRNNQAQNKDIPSTSTTSPSTTLPSEACDFKQIDNISCGEKSLISNIGQEKDPPLEKEQGMNEIKDGNYNKAQEDFEKAWKQDFQDGKPDPETIIYLNDAKIHNLINQQQKPKQKVYTIAVVAPLKHIEKDKETFKQGLEMLRGVAQAQKEAIEKGIYLQVAIGNDANNKEQASTIAEKLGEKQNILGVVGHSSSSLDEEVLPKYQTSGLVLISPASTSVKLSNKQNFYRTVPNNVVYGKKITEYLKNQSNTQKIAIFWSKNDSYSESLKDEVENGLRKDQIVKSNIKTSEIFDLTSNNFNAKNALIEAKNQGVTAIILIPDGGQSQALTNAYAVIKGNKDPNLIIIGGDTLYTDRTIKEENAAKNKLIVAVPWHPFNNKKFSSDAATLWRTETVSWLTATAYDATLVLTEAIKKNPSREGVNKSISSPDFKISQGATGEIQFNGSDLAAPQITLVKVLPYCQSRNYRFVPVEYSKNCAVK